MKNKMHVVIILLTITLSIIKSKDSLLSGQDSLQIELSGFEDRLFKLETAQKHVITSLNTANEQNKTLLTGFGAVLGGLFVLISIVTFIQIRREGFKEANQASRESARDLVENAGVKQVSEIMDVVKRTLKSRLDAETEARADAKKKGDELEKVRREVKDVSEFLKNFQSNIQSQRKSIEENASLLVQLPRHKFRLNLTKLNSFAMQFDSFKSQFEALDNSSKEFSAEPLYIRGIASHYANHPQDAKYYLDKVTKLPQTTTTLIERAYKRRLANTYYYLGVIALNFGNAQNAIDFFNQANDLDPAETDFLTKIVTAESYIMSGPELFGKAEEILDKVEQGLNQKRNKEGQLAGVYLRLESRISLIRTNMAILNSGDVNWLEIQKQLEEVYKIDPLYYYASATLAQIYAIQNEGARARKFFRISYENIEKSGDLQTVTEVRSQILLLMFASICCQHGLKDHKRSEEHLDKAESLRGSLPKINSQECTVFSTFSKKNEKSDTIHSHIGFIRKGRVLINENN